MVEVVDVLRKIESGAGVGGAGLLALGLMVNMESLVLPGAVMVAIVTAIEGARFLLRRSNINPPTPPDAFS